MSIQDLTTVASILTIVVVLSTFAFWVASLFCLCEMCEKQGRETVGWFILAIVLSPWVIILLLHLVGNSVEVEEKIREGYYRDLYELKNKNQSQPYE